MAAGMIVCFQSRVSVSFVFWGGGERGSLPLSASMFLSASITAGPFNSLRTWGDPTPQDATVNTHPHICTPKTLPTSRKNGGVGGGTLL